MKMFKQRLLSINALILCVLLFSNIQVDGESEEPEGELLESIRRQTPSGQYVDPASFFRLHGYISLSYAEPGEALDDQILVSGQSEITGKNEGGFKSDSALFLSTEPFDGISSALELHFVGNALDPIITEAKVTADFLTVEDEHPFTFRMMLGRYWWPFGIHSDEWFSAVNRFSVTSPAASQVVPAHYNEVGVMVAGEVKLTSHIGTNYLLSVGNGISSFEIMDNTMGGANQHDLDGNRTFTGRLGLALVGDVNLKLGFSAAAGDLRAGAMVDDPSDPRHYAADFYALGPDLSFNWEGLKLRSYYYMSAENMENASREALNRDGFTIEPSFAIDLDKQYLKRLTFIGRVSLANEDRLDGDQNKWVQYGIGTQFHITEPCYMRLGYVIQKEEKATPDVDDDILSWSLSHEF